MKTFKFFSVLLAGVLSLSLLGCKDEIGGGEEPIVVNKTELKSVIDRAKALLDVSTQGNEPGQYPASVMTAFTGAISDAEAVYGDKDATQSQVDNAAEALDSAIDTFQAGVIPDPTLDKSGLQSALSAANDIYDGAVVGFSIGEYRQADKDVFKAAIDAAQAIYDDGAATQAVVNQAVEDLETAQSVFQGAALTQDYDESLSLHLKMDGNADDASYYAHTATLVQRSGSQVPQLTTDRFGAANKAYAFNGNQIDIPNAPSITPSEATFSLWVNAAVTTGAQSVFSMNWWDGYYFKIENGQMLFQSTSAGGAYVGTWTAVEVGVWYHVAIVRSETAYQIYVNGVLDNEAEILTGGMVLLPDQPLVIGALSLEADEYPFNGSVDEFRLYSRVLSADEILEIYNTEKP